MFFLPLSSKDVRVGHRMTAKVRTFPFRGERGMVRNRRNPVVAAHPGKGPFTIPTRRFGTMMVNGGFVDANGG